MTNVANGIQIETIPEELLKDPLLWIFAEHHRQRQICQQLSDQAGSVVLDVKSIQEIITFLKMEMPLHIIDEEDDLFPLLRTRCEPEDNMEHTLGQLSDEHASDLEVGEQLISVLENALKNKQGIGISQTSKDIIESFCTLQRRHIAIENAVVLPIARLRLTNEDKKTLGRRLVARRRLPDPFIKRHDGTSLRK